MYFFFRQFKIFIKKIVNHIAIDELSIDVKSRNEIIKLNSLVFNQMQSDKYKPMYKYAWYKSGYTDVNPFKFQNVEEISFTLKHFICEIKDCKEYSFLICTHCDKSICFNHFYILYHFH